MKRIMFVYDQSRLAVVLFIVFQCASFVHLQCSISKNKNEHEEIYYWSKTVDFLWPNKTFEIQAKRINRNKFGVPIGIKVFQNRIYLTLPRWSGNTNIPANLVWAPRPQANCTKGKSFPTSPKLR
jgi:hypothetical protein